MAKCGNDWSRTFVGTIKRFTEPDSSKIIVGRIPVNEYVIISRGMDKDELGNRLDQLTLLVLDYNLNQMPAHMIEYAGVALYLN